MRQGYRVWALVVLGALVATPGAAKPTRPPAASPAPAAAVSPEAAAFEALVRGAVGADATDEGRRAMVDATLEHASEAHTFLLALGAKCAWDVGRVEDAIFLVWAAELHAQLESLPRAGGGERMMTGTEYVNSKVISEVSVPIEAAALEDADRYRAARLRLEAWKPTWVRSLWTWMSEEGSAPTQDAADAARAAFLDDLEVSQQLVAIPAWREAQAQTARCASVMDTPRCCPDAPEAWARRQRIEADVVRGRAERGEAPWAAWRTTVDEAFTDGPTRALVVAALQGDDAGIDAALREGASLEAVGARGYTPLLWVMGLGRVEPVLRLLAHGASPNTPGRDHWNPVMVAAATQDPAMLHALIEHGGDPNSNAANDEDRARYEREHAGYRFASPYSYDTAVTAAVGRECQDNAVWLVDHGGDPNADDFVGLSAIHGFVRWGLWPEIERWFGEGRMGDVAAFVGTLEISDAFDTPGACDIKKRLLAAAKAKGAPVPSAEWSQYTGHHDLDCLTPDYVLNEQDLRNQARERSDRLPKFDLRVTTDGGQQVLHVGDLDVPVDVEGAWKQPFRDAVQAQCDAGVGPRMLVYNFERELLVEVDHLLDGLNCPATVMDYMSRPR